MQQIQDLQWKRSSLRKEQVLIIPPDLHIRTLMRMALLARELWEFNLFLTPPQGYDKNPGL